ncbi:hypothetical protein C4568_03245 [Candidatus Parcubacteria bacterium]|nr:MAG: hypothetical protein C4568_03245 [Candidatus Parcubacteria bacterium]
MTDKQSSVVKAVIFYRDYIAGPLWEKRKEEYYSRHAKACYICGDTKGVELNHKKYGNYGHEKDSDLVALCRTHHQIITDRHKTRKNMHYQHDYMIDELKREWDAEHEGKSIAMTPVRQAKSSPGSVEKALESLANPIWKLFGRK